MVGRTVSHYKALEEFVGGRRGIVCPAADSKPAREIQPPELFTDWKHKRRFCTYRAIIEGY